ncbi:MAG: HAMP domain-containing protein [Methanomicrobiales archaeon]|nr:HAMP domain-containing protein [Methanomicrobiales archaeon]
MKMSIMIKLMGTMLILTMIPLAVLGFVALQDSKALGLSVVNDAKTIGDASIKDSTKALDQLGEQIISQKAQDVSKQLDIYIKSHPTMKLADLQADPYFAALAVQPVGKTGYTAVHDSTTHVSYFHSNPAVVGTSLNAIGANDPVFDAILQKALAGQDSAGYYDWNEADGVKRSKYMVITTIPTPTADGVTLQLAATTYISEFSAPAKQTESTIKIKLDKTTADIRQKTESVGTQNTILIVTFLTMIVVIIVSYFMALRITRPIKQLTEVANNVSLGDLSNTDVEVTSDDEIGELAGSFKRMVVSVKYYMKKAKSA